MLRILLICALACTFNPTPARSQPTPRAVFEYTTRYSFGYTFPDFHRYIDVYRGQIVDRIWIDSTIHVTCEDDTGSLHRSFLIAGDQGNIPTIDTYVILDMVPYQCPLGGTLGFVFPEGAPRDYRIGFVTGTNGQMVLYEPR